MTISVSGLVAAELSVGGLGEAWKKEIDNPLEQVDRSLSWRALVALTSGLRSVGLLEIDDIVIDHYRHEG